MACLILKLSILSFFTALIGSKGRDVFLRGGGKGPGASQGRVKVIAKKGEGHTSLQGIQGGGGDTHLSQNFFNEDFCEVAFHFSYRLSFSLHLL